MGDCTHMHKLFSIQSSDSRATKCVNNYKLEADIKQTRNDIYEYHRRYPHKDQTFIDKILEGKNHCKLI